MNHKYKPGDVVFWICPITFTIEKIKIEFCDYYDDNKEKPYYIDADGAYLYEFEMKDTLEDAKDLAYQGLVKMYFEKVRLIQNSNPKLENKK